MYHVGICLYLVIMCMHVLQTHVCGLTDDGVGSHFLANHCSIAAQEHWKWGHVSACVPLADFVHFTAIDCPILALICYTVAQPSSLWMIDRALTQADSDFQY